MERSEDLEKRLSEQVIDDLSNSKIEDLEAEGGEPAVADAGDASSQKRPLSNFVSGNPPGVYPSG